MEMEMGTAIETAVGEWADYMEQRMQGIFDQARSAGMDETTAEEFTKLAACKLIAEATGHDAEAEGFASRLATIAAPYMVARR